VIVGDGGFAHAWAEMETAVRSGIALTVVVLNNGVLGYQKDAEEVSSGVTPHRVISDTSITLTSRVPAGPTAKPSRHQTRSTKFSRVLWRRTG
jgi:Thiamine pyrophosphate enzyme, C-terminal TPP binding domain